MTCTFSHIESFTKPYKYKYNGKEFQDELGLDWYDYEARNYDPAIARWVVPDPLLNDLKTTINFDQVIEESDDIIDMSIAFSEKMKVGGGVYNPDNLNPYTYGYNNPVSFDDPDGRCPICISAGIGALGQQSTSRTERCSENYSI